MVHGIETFRNYFGSHLDRYVIIGGTACNLVYSQYGAQERATQDIDMIIVAEAFDRDRLEPLVEKSITNNRHTTQPISVSLKRSRKI